MDAEPSRARVLLVSDWTFDPHAVVAAATACHEREPAALALLVPAWLHGLDWVGDPQASVPCAQRQVDVILGLAAAAGLTVCDAAVGDPDPATAIVDALERWPAAGVLLCARSRRLLAGPLDFARRVHRLTGLPVQRVAMATRHSGARRSWPARRLGHCTVEAAGAASPR